MAALTNAERQQRYRERHLGSDKMRLLLDVSAETRVQLDRLARHFGCSVTRLIERLAATTEKRLLARLPETEQRTYLKS
jgi:AraC-like DNA-binding protein